MKIARASLPKKLERTLDASAFVGPIRSVSTYADPDDASAIRVEVALADGEPHPKPQLTRDAGTLTWEFPRAAYAQRGAAEGGRLRRAAAAADGAGQPARRRAIGDERHVYTGRRIELDFMNADIHNILRLLADVGQVNIVTRRRRQGHRHHPHARRAVGSGARRHRASPRGSACSAKATSSASRRRRCSRRSWRRRWRAQKAAVELKPLETELIPLSYADGAQILPRVQEVLSPRGKVSVDERTNMLIVTDVAGNIALAEDLVRNLDTQTPQVLIEARIVEARTTFPRDIGIQWGGNAIASAATGNPTGLVFPSTVGRRRRRHRRGHQHAAACSSDGRARCRRTSSSTCRPPSAPARAARSA